MLDYVLLQEAVEFLRRERGRKGADLARVVGEYVLRVFFKGDYREFSRKSRSKPVMFRALLAHPDLPFSRSTLCTLVRVSQQLEKIPSEVAGRLSLAHHRALLPLEDDLLRQRLAKAAIRNSWTRERLEQEVRGLLPDKRVGRKPHTTITKAERQLSAATDLALDACDLQHELDRLDSDHLHRLVATVEDSRSRLAEVSERLRFQLRKIAQSSLR